MTRADVMRRHYTSHWGEPAREAWFADGDHAIEVFKWDEGDTDEGVYLYATSGASARPMPGGDPSHRVEFILGLNPAQDEAAAALASLGLHAARSGAAVDHGHTVPSDRPLWHGTEMRTFLVMRPAMAIVPPLALSDGAHVEFLQATPIFDSDRAYKVEHGSDALIERWREGEVPYWDPRRRDIYA